MRVGHTRARCKATKRRHQDHTRGVEEIEYLGEIKAFFGYEFMKGGGLGGVSSCEGSLRIVCCFEQAKSDSVGTQGVRLQMAGDSCHIHPVREKMAGRRINVWTGF